MKNILVTSLGISWSIVPELVGFTNPGVYDLYKNHPEKERMLEQLTENDIKPVDEVWCVTTNGAKVAENLEILKKWVRTIEGFPVLRLFSYDNLVELDSMEQVAPMSDLVYRVVLHAKEAAGGGKLYLSLAGGRKNMSADVQNAAYYFGCDALLHVMDNGKIPDEFKKEEEQIKAFTETPGEEIRCFDPLVLDSDIDESPILYVEPKIKAGSFPLEESLKQTGRTDLYDEMHKRRKESANSLLNIYKQRAGEMQGSYTAFQLLPPLVVEKLRSEKIGSTSRDKEKDIRWLKKIPKAELHCHFGGILSPEEMIEVASVLHDEIEKIKSENSEFKQWLQEKADMIKEGAIESLPAYNPKKDIKGYWLNANQSVPEPYAIAAFLNLFNGNAELLKEYIYHDVGGFKSIGIEKYEQLGDFQGSSLLQHEKTIRKTCQVLKRQCEEHNIKYIEVRCSPVNYTRGGLKATQVVEIMMDEFKGYSDTVFKLIFIASRHGNRDTIQAHIDLAMEMLQTSKDFTKMFVGFDLAGAESANSPKELRDIFLKILEKSIPTTIHAGEDMTVKNIWEAVYHLSAERIGHGLTLNDDEDLKRRIIERKIAIELCPSSNDQIVGYRNFLQPAGSFANKIYPLKQYLNEGLKVTVNTDDPGISLTNLTEEYYKAASMCDDGLSKWEILQINRNGFKYGFMRMSEKKDLLIKAEEELFKVLNDE